MAKATLFNPTTKKRVAVESGSDQAQSLFSQGYFLETSYNPTTGESTFDDPKQTQQNRSMSSLAKMLPPKQDEIDIQETTPQLIETDGRQSIMGEFLQKTRNSALSQTETAIQNTIARIEEDRLRREAEQTKIKNEAAAKLEEVQQGESLEDIRRRLIDEFELEETRKQLQNYKQELAALDEQYQMADLAIQNKPINASIIRGQRALKQQEYAAKATTVQAKVAIVGEQYNLAADMINNLFEAAAVDRQNTISYYEKLYDLADQKLINLDAEERENISSQISLIQDAEKNATANREKIVSLFEDPILAQAFQKSGADLTMDFDKVMERMLPFIIDENKKLELLQSSTGGANIKSSTSSFTQDIKEAARLLSSSRDAGDLTDLEYNSVVSQLVDSNYNVEGMTPEQVQEAWNQMSSLVNTAMEGKSLSQAQTSNNTTQELTPEEAINENPSNVLSSWFTNLSDKVGFTSFATRPSVSSFFDTIGLYDRFGLDYDPKTNEFKNK